MSKETKTTAPAPEVMTAEEIVAKAQAEAEAIRAAALTEANDIRQQAEEEAAEIRKDAEAAAKEAAPVPAPAAPKHDEGEEYVYVELFKDNGRYKDDVLVCVNGESCQIKRGVRVRIKRKFLWAIQNQMRQDANTANMIQEMHEAFDDAARANGVKL